MIACLLTLRSVAQMSLKLATLLIVAWRHFGEREQWKAATGPKNFRGFWTSWKHCFCRHCEALCLTDAARLKHRAPKQASRCCCQFALCPCLSLCIPWLCSYNHGPSIGKFRTVVRKSSDCQIDLSWKELVSNPPGKQVLALDHDGQTKMLLQAWYQPLDSYHICESI